MGGLVPPASIVIERHVSYLAGRAEHSSILTGQRVMWFDRLDREAASDIAAT